MAKITKVKYVNARMMTRNMDDPDPKNNLWCNSHQRPAYLCKTRGGIMLPCSVVDLTDKMEIEYADPKEQK